MPNPAFRLPTPLARAAERFEKWRRNRTTHSIPAELWALAADLGARYGVSRTARALRVQYYGLKKRIDAAPASETAVAVTPSAFVEIRTAPAVNAIPGE